MQNLTHNEIQSLIDILETETCDDSAMDFHTLCVQTIFDINADVEIMAYADILSDVYMIANQYQHAITSYEAESTARLIYDEINTPKEIFWHAV